MYLARASILAATVAILFTIASVSHAQPEPATPTASEPAPLPAAAGPVISTVSDTTSARNEVAAAKQQVKVLEAQLETIRQFQSSVLDTIYWALGGVFLLLGVIVGVGWWSNFKVYERDKESMRDALLAEITLKFGEQEQTLRANAQSSAEDTLTKTTGKLEEMIKPVAANIKAVERRVFALELMRMKSEMEDASTPSIALTKALNCLDLCAKKSDGEVPNIINFMLRKLDEGGKFTALEITRANELIDSLPPRYAALNDRLRQKLVASEIFQVPG